MLSLPVARTGRRSLETAGIRAKLRTLSRRNILQRSCGTTNFVIFVICLCVIKIESALFLDQAAVSIDAAEAPPGKARGTIAAVTSSPTLTRPVSKLGDLGR